jgi:HK97 family phage major capsid protein
MLRACVLGPRNEVERRALAEGSDSAGGFSVPTILSAELIDRMRAASTVLRAGARTVLLESDRNSIAKLLTDPTASWKAENILAAESDPTFGQIVLRPRTLVSLVRVSRELLEDSVNIESTLMNSFSQALALELDRVALRGSGAAEEPQGIVNTSGIGLISLGTNGGALTNFDKIVDALETLENANSQPATAAIMAPRTRAALTRLKDTTNQVMVPPASVSAIPMLVTTQIGVVDVQGTSSNASRIVLGHFPELLIGVRSELRIEILRERYADQLQYGFLAWLRADIALAHAESFCQVIGIIP